ncbi:MAG: hypothetical protein RL497_1999 [Pseudomonadota bacterium]|jgi:hypothetical protein
MQQQLINLLKQNPQFTDIISWIDQHYRFTPTTFQNGAQHNEANQNNGSCKVFALALLLQLTQEQTLALFCEHYQAVLKHPEATDHQNIRQFMQQGFNGLNFEAVALTSL